VLLRKSPNIQGTNNNLQHLFDGPYEVKEVHNNNTLTLLINGKTERVTEGRVEKFNGDQAITQ